MKAVLNTYLYYTNASLGHKSRSFIPKHLNENKMQEIFFYDFDRVYVCERQHSLI